MSGVGTLTTSNTATLVRQAETNASLAVTLLKNTVWGDADIVAKLLPVPGAQSSANIDVRA